MTPKLAPNTQAKRALYCSMLSVDLWHCWNSGNPQITLNSGRLSMACKPVFTVHFLWVLDGCQCRGIESQLRQFWGADFGIVRKFCGYLVTTALILIHFCANDIQMCNKIYQKCHFQPNLPLHTLSLRQNLCYGMCTLENKLFTISRLALLYYLSAQSS